MKSLEPNLDAKEIKAAVKVFVNGGDESLLSDLAKSSLKKLNSTSEGQSLLLAIGKRLFPAGKYIFPGVGIIGALSSARTGFSGEGHRPVDGVTGAVVEIGYDAFMVEQVEEYVFPSVANAIQTFSDWFSLDSLGKHERIRIEQCARGL